MTSQQHVQFSGDWIDGRKAELDKARRMAHGDFLWFTHGGKSYVVDDPATVSRIQKLYRPMDESGPTARKNWDDSRKSSAGSRKSWDATRNRPAFPHPTSPGRWRT